MSDFVRWMWRDQPIPDIRAWARERGEQMVCFDEHREGVAFTADGPQIVRETTQGKMPESFWNGTTSRMTAGGSHWYVETGREDA